ncbi:MAG: FAD:protein FMN transferase [Pirellulaceae bacterium]|nr:FAD:protein FMN transferase [Pirellulaceae bacterium]
MSNKRPNIIEKRAPFSTDISDNGTHPEGLFSDFLLHFSQKAMGCEFSLYCGSKDKETSLVADQAFQIIADLEDQLSIFRSNTLVSRLNHSPVGSYIKFPPAIFFLLRRAVELSLATDGLFDITTNRLKLLWKEAQKSREIPLESSILSARNSPGIEGLDFNEKYFTVGRNQKEVEVDLGSIGKGFALDKASEYLLENQAQNYLLHGGTSSLLAQGSHPNYAKSKGPPGWEIGIPHPRKPQQLQGKMRLYNKALATSNNQTQFFYHQGERYGHLLDPRTGYPVSNDLLSVTVVSPDATEADALATAFFIMGFEKAALYCEKNPEIGAIFSRQRPKKSTPEIVVINVDSFERTL